MRLPGQRSRLAEGAAAHLVDAHDVPVAAQKREQAQQRAGHQRQVHQRRVLRKRPDDNLASRSISAAADCARAPRRSRAHRGRAQHGAPNCVRAQELPERAQQRRGRGTLRCGNTCATQIRGCRLRPRAAAARAWLSGAGTAAAFATTRSVPRALRRAARASVGAGARGKRARTGAPRSTRAQSNASAQCALLQLHASQCGCARRRRRAQRCARRDGGAACAALALAHAHTSKRRLRTRRRPACHRAAQHSSPRSLTRAPQREVVLKRGACGFFIRLPSLRALTGRPARSTPRHQTHRRRRNARGDPRKRRLHLSPASTNVMASAVTLCNPVPNACCTTRCATKCFPTQSGRDVHSRAALPRRGPPPCSGTWPCASARPAGSRAAAGCVHPLPLGTLQCRRGWRNSRQGGIAVAASWRALGGDLLPPATGTKMRQRNTGKPEQRGTPYAPWLPRRGGRGFRLRVFSCPAKQVRLQLVVRGVQRCRSAKGLREYRNEDVNSCQSLHAPHCHIRRTAWVEHHDNVHARRPGGLVAPVHVPYAPAHQVAVNCATKSLLHGSAQGNVRRCAARATAGR